MKRVRWLLIPIAAAVLLVPAVTQSRTLAVSATADVRGSGGTWQLLLTNTGDQAIHCMRMFAPAPPPDITFTGVQGSGAALQGDKVWGATLNLAPGQTATYGFQTNTQFDPNKPPETHVSGDCVTDVTAKTTVTIPVTPPPPPTPKPKPKCKCKKLTIKIDPTLFTGKKLPPTGREFGVGITWRMTCSKGNGNCRGFVTFMPPVIKAGSLPAPRNGLLLNLKTMTFVCRTACNTSKQGRFQIQMTSRDQLNKLFGRTMVFTVKTVCGTAVRNLPIKIGIDSKGRFKALP